MPGLRDEGRAEPRVFVESLCTAKRRRRACAARHARPCRAAARRARLDKTTPRGALDVGVAVRQPRGIASRSGAHMVARTLCEDTRHSVRIDRAGLTGGQAAREASIACVPFSRAASS
jgi:hypothetical protein